MSSVTALVNSPRMIIESDLLGPIEVAHEDTIHFSDGLLGFPECHDFVLLPAANDGLFWLQSADHSALAFLLVDPFRFCDGYTVELGPLERSALEANAPSDIVVLSIVTLPRQGERLATTNLQGPLAINLARGRGRQLVLSDSDFGIRWEIDLTRSID